MTTISSNQNLNDGGGKYYEASEKFNSKKNLKIFPENFIKFTNLIYSEISDAHQFPSSNLPFDQSTSSLK
jgi:hypothetical protein